MSVPLPSAWLLGAAMGVALVTVGYIPATTDVVWILLFGSILLHVVHAATEDIGRVA